MDAYTFDNYYLKIIDIKDADDLYEFCNDEETTKFMPFSKYESKDDAVKWLEHLGKSYQDNLIHCFGIYTNDINKLIGYVHLELDKKNNSGEIGFMLNKKYWGQGITTEASKCILSYAFDVLKLNRVEAQAELDNKASLRTLEKIGMKLEGIMQEERYKNGHYIDRAHYAILKRNYKK